MFQQITVEATETPYCVLFSSGPVQIKVKVVTYIYATLEFAAETNKRTLEIGPALVRDGEGV